jgi:hypothetical protein
MPIIIYFSAYSIFFPALIAVIRYRYISRSFYPFIFLVWVGMLNEVLSFQLISHGYQNTFNTNIYSLAEALLLFLQFYMWKLFISHRYFVWLSCIIFLAWITDNLFLSSIHDYSSYFSVFYSFIIVLLSILMINKVIVAEKSSLFRNSIFLLCSGFVFYFTYNVLIETFWICGLNLSDEFKNRIYMILDYVNLFINMLYAIAILWIPRKQEFIQQY